MSRNEQKAGEANAWWPFLRSFAAIDDETRIVPPYLSEEQILVWADSHFARTGDWPNPLSGPIAEAPGESWLAVEAALSLGLQGLPGGSTLIRVLAEKRGRYHPQHPPELTRQQILAWADVWRQQTGRWPRHTSGVIPNTGGITWAIVHAALYLGRCGLPGGSSLRRLLAAERGVFNHRASTPLTEELILVWADEYHNQTGHWPNRASGRIFESRWDTWSKIDGALKKGARGLPGGSSLAGLLAERRHVRNLHALPALSEAEILAWADAHREHSGNWPGIKSGAIPEAPGETWQGIERALNDGGRGLVGGSSLAQLLAERRGRYNRKDPPVITVDQIVVWADAWHDRVGEWPIRGSGTIPDTGGINWSIIDHALRHGRCGLPGGSSLARLLADELGVPNRLAQPRLTEAQILFWADAYHEQTGAWPKAQSDPIALPVGETWVKIDLALRKGAEAFPVVRRCPACWPHDMQFKLLADSHAENVD